MKPTQDVESATYSFYRKGGTTSARHGESVQLRPLEVCQSTTLRGHRLCKGGTHGEKTARITFVRYLLALLILFCGPAFGQARSYELQADQRTGTIKRIFVLCHSHLDIGFTRPPDEVARDYKDNIDAAIRLTRENQDFRWTIESAWMLEEWLRRTDDDALIAELGRMLSDGRLGLGPTFATMHSGLMGAGGIEPPRLSR